MSRCWKGVICGTLFVLLVGGILWWHTYVDPVYQWRQLFRLPLFAIVSVLLVVILSLWVPWFDPNMKLGDAILAGTAFILLWYTLETYAMRWETAEQTRQTISQTREQMRPVLTLRRSKNNMCIANLGKGLALNAHISSGPCPAPVAPAQVGSGVADVVPLNECVFTKALSSTSGVEGAGNLLRITYDNLEGIKYCSIVRVEAGRYFLEKTDRLLKTKSAPKEVSAGYGQKPLIWWSQFVSLVCILIGPSLLAVAYQEIRGGTLGTLDERGRVKALVGVKYRHLWFIGFLTMVFGSVLQIIVFIAR